jgi:hypothetical protein
MRQQRTSAQHHAARVSSDVAEVANRPKNRPGSRERSSMTMRWTVLVRSRTILKLISHRKFKCDMRLLPPSLRAQRSNPALPPGDRWIASSLRSSQ